MKQDIKKIQWPTHQVLKDKTLWAQNVRLVKALCRLCVVTEWLTGEKDKDEYTLMPYRYEVRGVKISFLPHWGQIEIGGETFYNIHNWLDLHKAIAIRANYLDAKRKFSVPTN